MGVFNALEFDGINSLDYGVYITGEAVFNSPQRAVEAVTVPGRNGDVLLDLGRYENIEVTYHAGVFGVDQSQFATKIRAFRNMLASRVGYKRIVDTYNPTEYRLGTFVAPVDVTPSSMNRHGEFDIVFNCKPQRFLMDGENAITVTDGQSVFNPTPFDAQPLLAVEGYGEISFNGYEIALDNAVMGNVTLHGPATSTSNKTVHIQLQLLDLLNNNDTINVAGLNITQNYTLNTSGSYSADSSATASNITATITKRTSNTMVLSMQMNGLDFIKGTSASLTASVDFYMKVDFGGGSSTAGHRNYSISVDYDGDSLIDIYIVPDYMGGVNSSMTRSTSVGETTGVSTVLLLGNPTYIDCELGEAYKVENGEYISLNEYIDLGSDLPTLAPGNNEFTFDDSTMTDVKLTPRYWIL